jgi:heme exporter protein A
LSATGASVAVSVQGLSKSFGDRLVLRGLDLTVQPGESLTIIGHNGSGKTTLIRILAGLARPTEGVVRIYGARQGPNAVAAQRAVGVVSHHTFLYPDLTPVENLGFYGHLYDVPDLNRRIEASLEQFALTGYRRDPVRALSRGTQQRLSIARALLPDPPLVLLDEPDSGLDPQSIALLPRLLAMAGLEQRTTILTTHNLALGLTLAQRIAVLARGRLAWEQATADLTVDDLRDAYYANLPKTIRDALAAAQGELH